MTNCEHDPTDICKSCNQTIREGGAVALHEKPEPTPAPVVKPEVKVKAKAK